MAFIFRMVLISCCAFFGWGGMGFAQNVSVVQQADSLLDEGAYDLAKTLLLKTYNRCNDKEDSSHCISLEIALGKVFSSGFLGRLDSSNYYFLLAEKQISAGRNDSLKALIYNLLGQNYHDLSLPDISIRYLEKSLEVDRRTGDPFKIGRGYFGLARTYHMQGNYIKALEYYNHSDRLFRQKFKPGHRVFGSVFNNKANTFKVLGDFELALENVRKAILIKRDLYPEDHFILLNSYITTADVFLKYKKPDSALVYLEKILLFKDKENDPIADAYGFAGQAYMQKIQYRTALTNHREAIRIYEKVYGPNKSWALETYADMAETFRSLGEFDSALFYYQKAIIGNCEGFDALDPQQYPSPDQVNLKMFGIDLLAQKAQTFMAEYLEEGENRKLLDAYNAYQHTLKSIDNERELLRSENVILYFGESAEDIYHNALEVAFLLYQQTEEVKYFEWAFEIAEKNKSYLLYQSMHASQISGSILDPQTRQVEQELLADLSIHRENLQNAKRINDQELIEHYESELFRVNERREAFREQLELKHPEYFKMKYVLSYPSPDQVIEHLLSDTKLAIEYVLTKDHIYVFALGENIRGLYQIKKPESFDQLVIDLRKSLLTKSEEDFRNYSNQLHKFLIGSIEINPKVTELLIVPHGVLNYLPFDLLISSTEGEDFRTLNYLVRDYCISYDHSLTIAYQKARISERPQTEYPLIAFAPNFSSSDLIVNSNNEKRHGMDLVPLQGAESEAEKVSDIIEGTVFKSKSASETQFKEMSEKASVVHIATHAVIDDDQPAESRLLFSSEKDTTNDSELYAYELMNLDMKAQLVVLSACNTGYGQIKAGEGVLSLGRAFAFAGVPSVLMSTWPISDKSTVSLMELFYRNLVDGAGKDKALHQAKLEYLQSADQNSANPYYWAGFILQGDPRPINPGSGHTSWLYMGLFILISLSGYYYFRSKV